MKSTSLRARALACALLTGTALCGLAAPASAQGSPTYRNLDSNGVDLVRGDFLTSFPEGSIGSGEAKLVLLRMIGATGSNGTTGTSQWDHMLFSLVSSTAYVDFGSRMDTFPGAESRGALLAGSGDSYQYRSPDGTIVAFTDPSPGGGDGGYCGSTAGSSCRLLPTSVTSPDGKVVTINYQFYSQCTNPPPPQNPEDEPEIANCQHVPRIASVTNSYGYEIRFTYETSPPYSGTAPASFQRRTGASFYNTNAGSSALASVSYAYSSGGIVDVTDQGGRTWRVTSSSTNYAIRRPGALSDTTSASLSGGVVTSVTKEGVTTNYSRSVSGSTATMTATQVVPGGTSPVTTIVSNLTSGRPTSITDALNRTTGFQYDGSNRLERVTRPEGNYVHYTYDARGNVIQTAAVPKGGSGATIVTSASYDSTCSNPVTCNRPNSTTDARGNVTDYEYDPTHGGVTKIKSPAPTTGAVRPETRYSYTLTDGEYRLTGISECQTTSSCTGTADEVKTVIAYNPDGSVYWTATGNGSATLVATTTMAYDSIGNLATVDGPLAGTADTVRTRYNSARQVVGTVSPDPDGSGTGNPLKHRATRNTYHSATGLLVKVEKGNVDSQSDADWALFSPAQAVKTTYDDHARPIITRLTSGSTVHALSQTSYDALGRPDCVAQRMNTAVFGTVTATSACSLGTQGSDGPDRITKNLYDAAGRVYQVKTALGVTGEQADELTQTFTANGLLETVTDAESNKTTFVYDGHDRLSQTFYPSPTKGAGASNGADYEQLTYESLAGGTRTSPLVTTFRNRANQSIGFGYDALGRQTFKDLPGSEPDATYGYDLLGQLTSSSQTGSSFTFTYDALGRLLSETGPRGTVASDWDLAGRRTRLTHPDGFYVDQDHLVTGEIWKIRQNGATSGIGVLATFGYDQLGRRSSLTRGNGTVTSYVYDNVSRLASLGHDLGGTTYDLTLAFGYNPASQINSSTRSNDAYAWLGHGSGTTSSTANGLNQITLHGGSSVGHDSKGNTTSDPAIGKTYAYSSENLLTSVGLGGSVTGTLAYDPLMRLQETGVSQKTRFVHDGEQRIAEYYGTANTLVARFVNAPGLDEPLVEYEGSGLSTRRWLHADERGSIVARSDDSGNLANINTFDDQGLIGSTNAGRFHFAGQPYETLSDTYYSRARMRNPRMGRFLQPDPIGYGDGMNIYAYVGGDPVNFVDPLGLQEQCGGDNEPECEVTVWGNPFGGSGSGGSGNSGWGVDGSNIVEDVTNAVDEGYQEIVVTGGKDAVVTVAPSTLPPRIIWAGGAGFDSGLPRDPEVLKKMLEEAKKAKDTALARRIQKQQKMINARNVGKERGLGKFRIFNPFYIIIPILEQQLHQFHCQYGIDDGLPCYV